MEVISLNSTNFIGLSTSYTPDKTVKFDQEVYYTEQGVSLPLAQVFTDINDSSTNNFSNLFLTQATALSSVAYIEDLDPILDDSFTTYLAVNAIGGVNDNTRYLVVEEPDFTQSVASISMSGVRSKIDNRYFFDITFIDDRYCKVEHVVQNTVRYLTCDIDDQLFFSFNSNTDYLGELSPQIFVYTYDRDGDFLVLSKTIKDVPYFLTYNSLSGNLEAIPPLTGANTVPYTPNAIFACIPRSEIPNDTKLVDPWVSYQNDFKTNSQNINTSRSSKAVNTNLLINSEYSTVTGTELGVNALSLKNTNTPENLQSRNNPFQANKSLFLNESDVEQRVYKKLFTGSNQIFGDDNITLGYESYTTDILLPKDKVTYFHVPQILYPFKQINISESGLIEAGAIAGDHPVKSDKIFKKLADAKYTSPYGEVIDESNGTFLCSWLSGSSDIKTKPIWVDRYYNPSKVTFINALTTRSLNAISYDSVFQGLVKAAGNIPGTDDVFDTPSSLVFESGSYYAYHHYGPNDVVKFIQTFTPYIVDKGIERFYYTNQSSAVPDVRDGEYVFNGKTYGVSNPLSSIQISNQFTLSFDMFSSDWSKPLGYQIFGNFLDDGFGIFNQNIVTPTVLVNTVTGVSILNTDLKEIKSINFASTPRAFIRSNFGENYSVVFNDGLLRQYTCDDNPVNETFSPFLSSILDFTNDDTTAYILCSSAPAYRLLGVNLQSSAISALNPAQYTAYFAAGAGSVTTNFATTIERYNNTFFFTPGIVSRRISDKIYYLTQDKTKILEWSDIGTSTMATTTAFSLTGTNSITDFNIDFDGNIWILQSKNVFYKYTQNREFLLSGTLTSNTSSLKTVQLTGNGSTTFKISNSGSTVPSDYIVTVNEKLLRPIFDYTITSDSISFLSPTLSGDQYRVSRLIYEDTYTNYKVNFVADFYNGEYKRHVLFTRVGYIAPNTSSLSAQAYQFNLLEMNGTPVLSAFVTAPSGNPGLTNTNFIREYVQDVYPAANLNINAITRNVYDDTDLSNNEIVFNLSGLDPGYHHFAVRFDAYHGFMSLFVDGQKSGDVQFAPRKYKFSNLLYRPFLIGTSCFNNSTPLYQYLKKDSYIIDNVKIRNLYLYSIPLNDCDIVMHARESRDIQDIHFDIPCGRRNYLEEIERYFKATIPGSKSTQYNIVLRNTGITDEKLRKALEERIAIVLANSAPVYSKLNKIKWVN